MAFEAALVKLVESARLKKEEDDRRRLEKEQIAKERAELEEYRARQQALIDAEDARLEKQRQEQIEAQAKIDAEKQRLAEAAKRSIAEGAQAVAAANEEERLHDEAMNADLNAEIEVHRRKHDDKIAAETWRDARPDDDGSGITVGSATETMEEVIAPWTDAQVVALNRIQMDGSRHPYTCGNDSRHVLVATADGWVCPEPRCGYRQTWAHLEDASQPTAEAPPSRSAVALPASAVSPSPVSSPSVYQPDVKKVQSIAKLIRGLPYPSVQSEAARSFLSGVQHKLKVIADECEAYQ